MVHRFTSLKLAGLLALTNLLTATSGYGQVLQSEPFTGATSANWRVGGNASFTAGQIDPAGNGYLRLTSFGNNQSGFALSRASFPSAQGCNISFDFYSYDSGRPGDGFSVFLIDGATDPNVFTPGAYGGSLGYCQRLDGSNPLNGALNGYIGIGLDEFGNYANSWMHSDGAGAAEFPHRVGIRGPGNGTVGYNLLAMSDQLPFTLSVPTQRAPSTSPDFRRATVSITPLGGTYLATVRIQNGQQVTTAIRSFELPTPPQRLRLGFAGSTGDAINIHEVRNLVVIVPPIAEDDLVVTPNFTPVSFDVTTNDRAPGSTINPASVDLNPSTLQRDSVVQLGPGTFRVNRLGVVTFTPVSRGVVGDVQIPYIISSRAVYDAGGNLLAPATSTNPALITVAVGQQGPDGAALVSGPATVRPESQLTYTLTVTNLGDERLTRLQPYLTLSTPLTVFPGTAAPAGGFVNGQWRFVNNNGANALQPGESRTYTVSFLAPTAASGVKSVLATVGTASGNNPDPDTHQDNNNGTWANGKVVTNISTPLPAAPLPVELVRFAATLGADHRALVSWATASETNSAYYAVERRAGDGDFQEIGRVDAAGNSRTLETYLFQDKEPLTGLTYYRLRQVDKDASRHYSPVVAVVGKALLAPGLEVYPNPAASSQLNGVSLVIQGLAKQPLTLEILDNVGRLVCTQSVTVPGNKSEVALPIPATGLIPGMYVVRATSLNHQSWQTRLAIKP